MAILSAIRRWHFRDGASIREIARRSGLSRNTVRKYLQSKVVEPQYPARDSVGKLSPFEPKLRQWLSTEHKKTKKLRITEDGACWRQADDRREVPPHPPGQLRRRPGAHPGVGRADAVRAVRDPLLRRAARRDGRAAAPTPTVAGNGATGSGTAAQGRRAHAGDRRAAQRAGRQQRQPPGIPQPAALPRQRTAHPVGWGRHARRLPSHPLR